MIVVLDNHRPMEILALFHTIHKTDYVGHHASRNKPVFRYIPLRDGSQIMQKRIIE